MAKSSNSDFTFLIAANDEASKVFEGFEKNTKAGLAQVVQSFGSMTSDISAQMDLAGASVNNLYSLISNPTPLGILQAGLTETGALLKYFATNAEQAAEKAALLQKKIEDARNHPALDSITNLQRSNVLGDDNFQKGMDKYRELLKEIPEHMTHSTYDINIWAEFARAESRRYEALLNQKDAEKANNEELKKKAELLKEINERAAKGIGDTTLDIQTFGKRDVEKNIAQYRRDIEEGIRNALPEGDARRSALAKAQKQIDEYAKGQRSLDNLEKQRDVGQKIWDLLNQMDDADKARAKTIKEGILGPTAQYQKAIEEINRLERQGDLTGPQASRARSKEAKDRDADALKNLKGIENQNTNNLKESRFLTRGPADTFNPLVDIARQQLDAQIKAAAAFEKVAALEERTTKAIEALERRLPEWVVA